MLNAPNGLSTVSNHEAGQLRVLSEPIGSGAHRVGTFRAAVPLTSVAEAQRGLRKTFVVVGLGALALAIAIAIWLANLISRPLRRMAGVAAQIDAGDLSHRIEYEGKDEIGVLAEAFNHMLDRLEAGFRRQRQFVSDASHELRSPLTVLRGRIELLARDGGDPDAFANEAPEILREISRMDRLVADMLTLAQAERGQLLQRRPLSVEDFVEDLRRDLPLLGDRSYRVDSDLAGTLDADPDRLAQVVRNLVSNAVRHTGADGQSGSRSAPATAAPSSRSATTATASRRSGSSGSSTASTAPTPAAGATKAAAASGWRSRERSSRPTGARSRPSRRPGPGRRSASRSRASRGLGKDRLARLEVDQRDRLRRTGPGGVEQVAARAPSHLTRATSSSTSNASGASAAQSP